MRCIFFSKGGALESQKDTAFCEEDGKLYIWNGPYPKLIEAGSTPETSGGVGPGAWVSTGDNASFVRIWKYRAVADGETTIQLPTDIPVANVQTIYVNGLRQDFNEGFTYNANNHTIILADELEAGDLVTVIIGITDLGTGIDIFAALKGTDGASNVGTSSGDSVQDVLDNLLLKSQQLTDKLASNNGASNIGTLDGITVEDALSNNAANIREHWRRQLSDAGLNLVDGSFEEGATVSTSADAVWHIAGGQCYTWGGAFPKAVPADSTPTSTGGIGPSTWAIVGDSSLKSVLSKNDGYSYIGELQSVAEFFGLIRQDGARVKLRSWYPGWSATDYGKPSGGGEFIYISGVSQLIRQYNTPVGRVLSAWVNHTDSLINKAEDPDKAGVTKISEIRGVHAVDAVLTSAFFDETKRANQDVVTITGNDFRNASSSFLYFKGKTGAGAVRMWNVNNNLDPVGLTDLSDWNILLGQSVVTTVSATSFTYTMSRRYENITIAITKASIPYYVTVSLLAHLSATTTASYIVGDTTMTVARSGDIFTFTVDAGTINFYVLHN